MDKNDLKRLKKKVDKYRKMISSGNKNLSLENMAIVNLPEMVVGKLWIVKDSFVDVLYIVLLLCVLFIENVIIKYA